MKTRSLIYIVTAALSMFLILESCHRTGSDAGEESAALPGGPQKVSVSDAQFTGEGMTTGKVADHLFETVVSGSGYIVPAPGGLVRVSTTIPGRIKSILVERGSRVVAGQKLFTLEGNELITLQQEYAAACSQLDLLRSNLERQRLLSEEQISAGKELLRAESEYRSASANKSGLEAKLRLVNIDPAAVSGGTIIPEASITAPLSGVVSGFNLVKGAFVEPGSILMDIVNPDALTIEIMIYEQHIAGLAAGQKVRFWLPGNRRVQCEASVRRIDKTVDPETRSLVVIANPKPGCSLPMAVNSFVEVSVITSSRTAPALPAEAVIKDGEQSLALKLEGRSGDGYLFSWHKISTGINDGEFVEIIAGGDGDFLTHGAYNLQGF